MKVNMEMVVRIFKSDETSSERQIDKARVVMSDTKLKEKFFADAAAEIEKCLDCKVEVLSCDISETTE